MGKAAPALSNFNAGELSPDMAGRVDTDKYPVGCSTLQNFTPRVQGGVRRRVGTRYVQSVKDSSQRTWLRKFIFSQGQAYQLEFGLGYIRFYTNHGRVSITTQAAWSSGTAYNVGDVVSVAGTNYYCVVANTGNNPAVSFSFWANMPPGIFEVPTPYITADTLTNSDGSCALQFEQSGDVVYITCSSYFTMQLTRKGTFTWAMEPYAPPDGPFLDENANTSPALYLTKLDQNRVNCFSTAPVFDPTDVEGYTIGSPGRLVRIDVQYFNVKPWLEQEAVTAGDLRRYNGNTYKALNAAAKTGPSPPINTSGTQWDGNNGVQWLYQDSGYGIGRVTGYTSPSQVVLTVSPFAGQSNPPKQYYRFPADVFASSATITGITAANPAVVTTSGHTFSVGDPVYLTNIQGMPEINNQMYIISAIGGATFTLADVDSTAYTPYVSGGTALKNATLNWSLGAWGLGRSGYTGSFPSAISFWSERLFLADGIQWWGSVPALYSSHTQDLFGQVTADCAMNGIISSRNVDDITWMNDANILLIGTKGGEFGLSPLVSTDPIGPANRQVVRQSSWRSRAIRPETIGTSNFYVQASGKKVMAQDYNFYIDRYDSTNQMRLANHIAGYTVSSGIIDHAWHQEPYETLWDVRSDGVLIGYVYDRPDNVTGWHQHSMGATAAGAAVVECISVIPAPDGTRDEMWMIVRRTINGQTVRSVEYMEKDFETGDDQTSMCYLDMSAVYSGSPTTTITGLSYLEGETVSVLRDGGGHPDCVVVGGSITLQSPGSVVQVGLAYTSALVTMDIEAGASVGTAQGKLKRVSQLTARVKNTLGGKAGMAGGTLDLLQPNVSTTALGSPPPLTTGDVTISVSGDHSKQCKLQIQESQPFQMEVLALFPIFTVEEPSPP